MATEKKKGFLRVFWDFFLLFSGVSTASNLERTQGRSLGHRGLFLIRRSVKVSPVPDAIPAESPRRR
jgi:hypothetical protein